MASGRPGSCAGCWPVVDPASVTAIVNVADDTELHGLHISPDLDTVTYTLADAIDPERGWGLRDETWHAMAMFERYGDALVVQPRRPRPRHPPRTAPSGCATARRSPR